LVRSARCRQFPRPLPILAAGAANNFPARCENEKVGLSPDTIRLFPVNRLFAPVNLLLSLPSQGKSSGITAVLATAFSQKHLKSLAKLVGFSFFSYFCSNFLGIVKEI
jgi:hypothetical protein